MSLIINPPPNAIQVYPWMVAQDFYISIIESVRASQAAIDPAFNFEISKNRLHPYIANDSINMLVNCMIGPRDDNIQASRHNKNVGLTYMFEILAKSNDEGSNRAGEIVAERAQYLARMVEFALTALYNNIDPALPIGTMDPRDLTVEFIEPQTIRQSESLMIFGSVNLRVIFELVYDDYKNLPSLTDIVTTINGNAYNFKANI